MADEFNSANQKSGGRETGTTVIGSNKSISIDQKNVQKLKEEIEKAILKQTDLSKLSKQIVITITSEGLKIDLIEDKGGTFFQSGSAKLSPSGVELLDLLSRQLKVLPNKLLIEGYTDAQAYSKTSDYSNWDLSADRANSARKLLQQGGVGPNQVSQVRGYGEQMLRVPSNPYDPTNRRVSLIVQWQDASASAANAAKAPAGDGASGAKDGAAGGEGGSAGSKKGSASTKGGTASATNGPAGARDGTAGVNAGPGSSPESKSSAAISNPPATKHGWADRLKSLIPEKKKHS
jgi:chemotaxis protein MotB